MFFECDERMHALYCSLAGRDGVWGFISDAKKHMGRVRRLSAQAGQLDQLVRDHQDVLDAVTASNMDRAQEVMQRKHPISHAVSARADEDQSVYGD
ncbi:FCD domain-containing protein [Shinella granuli]|uniref:FCD domain-containing protein n=1 Tax=Shinella granuli TaxID=323621 RepID=UPI001FE0F23A